MSKENFKIFVKNNPSLINYVKNNNKTWQELYEIYDLYGEDSNIWNDYINDSPNKSIFDLFKGIDLKQVQKTLNGLEKALTSFKDFKGDNNLNNYNERPINKYFED